MGIPDSYYTLKSKEQGQWRPQEQMRNDVLIRWVKGKFPIDDNRIVGEIGCWGMMEIERNDLYDASIGLRYLFLDSGVISVNFIVPLNDQGLRNDTIIPLIGIEGTF